MNRPAPTQAALPLQSHQRETEVQRITEIREDEEPGNIYAAVMALPIGDAEVPIDTLADHDLSELLPDHTSFSEDTGKYHSNWLRSGSKSRADKFRTERKLTFTNFGEIEVENPVNWTLGEDGRSNLCWQLHSFFFIRDFVAAHAATNDDWYLRTCEWLVTDWIGANQVATPVAKFAWNDHSTAYRILALSQLYIYLSSLTSTTSSFLAPLFRLILRHQAVLATQKFYSKGTNHGLDQAFYLYFSSLITHKHSKSILTRELAVRRLKYELLKSFAPDGVHIENSPEYHDLVLSSTLMMNAFIAAHEGAGGIEDLGDVGNSALTFLAYIVRPDGRIPTIGDSTGISPRGEHRELRDAAAYPAFRFAVTRGSEGRDNLPQSAIFPHSGYAIFRGRLGRENVRRIHLTYKCGFLSTYHRHDDDNAVVLFADGEDWLVDAGLYRYEEKDPQRKYFRSASAHNLMLPNGVEASRDLSQTRGTRISAHEISEDHATVTGISTMFPNFEYTRRIDFDQRSLFRIVDGFSPIEANSGTLQAYTQVLQIPADKELHFYRNQIDVVSSRTRRTMSIKFNSPALKSITALHPTPGEFHSRQAINYDQLIDIQTLHILYSGVGSVSADITLDLSRVVLE